MDAHVFRRIAVKLVGLLEHARIEKVFRPAKDILVFSLYAGQRKVFLFFRYGRQYQALFLSPTKPQAPALPDSEVMFLRKHCSGRRIVSLAVDWPHRRLLFCFAPRLPEAENQRPSESVGRQSGHGAAGDERGIAGLLLDLREGARTVASRPADFDAPVIWPECSNFFSAVDANERIWEAYPVITPLLRKTLAALDCAEGCALLADLESEACGTATQGETWVYAPQDAPAFLSAWPLPDSLRNGLQEQAFEDALEAAARAGTAATFARVAGERDREHVSVQSREIQHLKKVLHKLDLEEARLHACVARKQEALLLQAHLYAFDEDERRQSVVLDDPLQADQPARRIELDPRLTVRENMRRLFNQATRAARGFEHLTRRRQEVQRALCAAQSQKAGLEASGAMPGSGHIRNEVLRPLRVDTPVFSQPGKQVSSFISSDGFILLRGRSARGNREVLKMAAPHDYWFHSEDGPSAHVILRRKHAAQEVPERAMREAAGLVAAKSWRRQDSSARIMYALVRNVQAIKGAPDGKVRVVRSEGSLVVAVEPDLEQRLAKS